MASTNQSPEYVSADKRFLQAQSDEERLLCLEEMIRLAPKHKAGESMRANLRKRHIKLRERMEAKKKVKRGAGKPGLKKEGPQVVLIGLTNSGKSSILKCLTNAEPVIAPYEYTTKNFLVGSLDYNNVKIQVVDMPAVNHELFEQGIANTADLLLIIITSFEELDKIVPYLTKTIGKRLIVLNKVDLLDESEKRKIEAKLKTNKLNFIIFSAKTLENLNLLRDTMFKQFDIVRIYTKEPGKERSNIPIIMKPNPTVKDISEKIYKGLINNIKETRIWGPSSKFPGQKVGLSHELKDLDVVEFRTK